MIQRFEKILFKYNLKEFVKNQQKSSAKSKLGILSLLDVKDDSFNENGETIWKTILKSPSPSI